jgi:hypothetical protein
MADLSSPPQASLPAPARPSTAAHAGATITAGQAVYQDAATGKYLLADDNSATAGARVPVGHRAQRRGEQSAARGAPGGDITIGATLTAGVAYYLSDTPGGICPVADLATGEYPCVIGIAKSSVLHVEDQPERRSSAAERRGAVGCAGVDGQPARRPGRQVRPAGDHHPRRNADAQQPQRGDPGHAGRDHALGSVRPAPGYRAVPMRRECGDGAVAVHLPLERRPGAGDRQLRTADGRVWDIKSADPIGRNEGWDVLAARGWNDGCPSFLDGARANRPRVATSRAMASTITGFADLYRQLEQNLPKATQRGVLQRPASGDAADADRIEETAPERSGQTKASVRLTCGSSRPRRGSVRRSWSRSAPAAEVFWPRFAEHGTVKEPARPFVRPAFDNGVADMLERLKSSSGSRSARRSRGGPRGWRSDWGMTDGPRRGADRPRQRRCRRSRRDLRRPHPHGSSARRARRFPALVLQVISEQRPQTPRRDSRTCAPRASRPTASRSRRPRAAAVMRGLRRHRGGDRRAAARGEVERDVVFWAGSVEGPRDLGEQTDTGFVHRASADLIIRYARFPT